MTIKEKAEAFATDTLIDGRYDRIAKAENGDLLWNLVTFSTGLISYTTFYLAIKHPVKRTRGAYVVSFCYGIKGTMARLKALGEIYGFTVDSRGYFIATKNIRLMSGERLKKGDVLGRMFCSLLVGGTK